MSDMEESGGLLPFEGEPFKVFKERWFVLLVVTALNISNAMVWIAFAPVADIAAEYYGVSGDVINCYSLVFFIASVFPGILIMWFVDQKGLKQGIMIGVWLNALGPAVRALSTAYFIPFSYQYAIGMVGQILTAIAQPFFFFIQTKVAEYWFPEYQRTLATTIIGLANPIGIMIGTGLPPLFIKSKSDIPTLNSFLSIPGCVIAYIAVIGIRRSRPPTPPSYSATITSHYPYLQGVKALFKNRAYWLLLLYIGCALGTFSAMITVIEEFMCAKGYTNSFTGLCAALLILCGIIGSIITSFIVDKTKRFILVMKILICLFCLSFCALAVVARYSNMQYGVATAFCLVGLFGFSTYPIGLELGAECTFPVTPEATTTGFLMISGQIQGIIYLVLLRALSKEVSNAEVCHHHGSVPYDMTVSLLVLTAIVVVVGIAFVLLFDTEYKRISADRVDKVNQILGCEGYGSIQDSLEDSIRTDLPHT